MDMGYDDNVTKKTKKKKPKRSKAHRFGGEKTLVLTYARPGRAHTG